VRVIDRDKIGFIRDAFRVAAGSLSLTVASRTAPAFWCGMLTLPLFMIAAGALFFGVQFAIDQE
jgi:hypothetical protein